MYTHPHISSQLARDRQRDRLARAEQQRLARQLITPSRPARHGEHPARRLVGARRPARLRAVITRMTRQLAGAGQHRAEPSAAPPQA
jgi:hypothetical protein